jgi:hypothetical protein
MTIGSKHRHATLGESIENLCMRMAKRAVLSDGD